MTENAHQDNRQEQSAEAVDLVIDELLRAAVAAPSMHNTQPWRLRLPRAGAAIEMFIDPARMLAVSDPRGRAAYIACGAALFNVRVTAAAAGWRAEVRLTPDPGEPLLVAKINLAGEHRPARWERELEAAIFRRHTNREPYSDHAVPQRIRAELAGAASAEGAILHFLDDDEAARVRRLAADAERELLEDHAYREELARWVGPSRLGDGIPDDALGPRSAQGSAPVRDFAPGRHHPARYATFESRPQLLVLSVRADMPVGWLTAGQALERVWLTATCRDLSLCPVTQPLETADAWLVADPRSGYEEPQMIMRMGYGPPGPAKTPRRAVTDVMNAG
jgi:nitroreductase